MQLDLSLKYHKIKFESFGFLIVTLLLLFLQLNYTGILETTKIRKEGYSVRLTFDQFVNR